MAKGRECGHSYTEQHKAVPSRKWPGLGTSSSLAVLETMTEISKVEQHFKGGDIAPTINLAHLQE